MDEANLTQQEVAMALDVSQRAVSGWLQGSEPRSAKRKKLAEFLNVPLEVLEGKQPIEESYPTTVDEPKAVYGKLRSLPDGDISAFTELINSLPDGGFKERIIGSVFKGITDAILKVAEEEVGLSIELAKALTRKDYDLPVLKTRIEDYRLRQKSTSRLARELNRRDDLDLPIPKDVDAIKSEVLEYLESRLRQNDQPPVKEDKP